jgi:type IV pilus assembly protein PilE
VTTPRRSSPIVFAWLVGWRVSRQRKHAKSRSTLQIDTEGFSLVELVVALAIVAIIAAIAYPSYTNSVYKSRRAEGRALLQTVAAAQERYYGNRNKYTSATDSDGLAIPTQSEPGHFYTLAKIELGSNEQSFTLIAQPQAGQAGDPCASLTLESSGRRGIRSSDVDAPDICW